MPPAELISPAAETLRSLDWHTIVLVAALVLVAWGAFLSLSGLEGWILASSLAPWIRGLTFGAGVVLAGGAAVIFWVMEVPTDSRPAWIGLGVGAAVGGLIAARVTVLAFWRTWWLRIFLFGCILGLLVYLAGILAMGVGDRTALEDMLAVLVAQVAQWDQDGNPQFNWPGIAKLAIAFFAGGGLYTVAYQLFYPLVWLLRNGAMLAAGAILLLLLPVRESLAGLLSGDADAGDLRSTALANVRYLAAIAAGACVVVAYAMWTQNFSRRFRNFSRRVLEAKRGTFGMPAMVGGSVATAFATFGRMLTLKRSSPDQCRIFKDEDAEEEDEETDEEEEEGKGTKARKKKRKRRKSDE